MRRCALTLSLFLAIHTQAEETPLPFDPGRICRSSLDGVPRSLSIRQGELSWLGYDLERGTPFHVWRAEPGTPGLLVNGFTTRSKGDARFTDSTEDTWSVSRKMGQVVPATLHYLSCSERGDSIELNWEIRHEGGSIRIRERVPHQPRETQPVQAFRIIEITGLKPGWKLHPPKSTADAWTLSDVSGKTVSAIESDGTHRLILP